MRLRNVKNAKEILLSSPYYIDKPCEKKGSWNKVFLKSSPIHLEVGCGKGQFLINMAKEYPNINFIGMEYQESVLVRAIQKLEDSNIPNLKFVCVHASLIHKCLIMKSKPFI